MAWNLANSGNSSSYIEQTLNQSKMLGRSKFQSTRCPKMTRTYRHQPVFNAVAEGGVDSGWFCRATKASDGQGNLKFLWYVTSVNPWYIHGTSNCILLKLRFMPDRPKLCPLQLPLHLHLRLARFEDQLSFFSLTKYLGVPAGSQVRLRVHTEQGDLPQHPPVVIHCRHETYYSHQ